MRDRRKKPEKKRGRVGERGTGGGDITSQGREGQRRREDIDEKNK